MFIGPFAVEEPPFIAPSTGLPPVPPRKPVPMSQVLPTRGREREVQQLIHDLAVLAAKHDPPPVKVSSAWRSAYTPSPRI